MITRQNIPLKVLLVFLLASCNLLMADAQSSQPSEKQILTRSLVDSQNYVFVAQSAIPMSGRARTLTSQYDLKITQHSIVSYLPYFGRSDMPPIDPSQGGIQFTSKDFDYKLTEKKKGGWNIDIKPKDYRDVPRMFLTISTDGYASLQVTSNTRQSISFNGYITAPEAPKSGQ
jgi:Domain of unknown function (DUF4251)